ncbi:MULTISPECIES: hypothetical protein [unclassified Brevundimonas]|uniref:hypothetical protein n=1 Tax=unclassified Brevundimonas TaxID=2622653 RepID=UPI0006F8FF1E|nr:MULTISPECIES: hypothetical protein [unclassified Brevundimonas]KQY95677.1 hypothetical protein ASD25_16925 [Brevundimonas sp. Root1423]KRA19679.1 hypothetical protein ASD59_11800 [Brevundimonas sp. Root608]
MPHATRSRKPARLTPGKAKLAAEIRQQLMDQGGAAHREVIIGRILQRKGLSGLAADRARRALLSAFELHADPAAADVAPHLFELPFGPDSYRWALDGTVRPPLTS